MFLSNLQLLIIVLPNVMVSLLAAIYMYWGSPAANQSAQQSIRFFALFFLLIFIAFSLFAIRSLIGEIPSVAFTQTFVTFALMMLAAGLVKRRGGSVKAVLLRRHIVTLAAIYLFVEVVLFTYIEPSIEYRSITTFLFISSVYAVCLGLTAQSRKRQSQGERWMNRSLYVSIGCCMLLLGLMATPLIDAPMHVVMLTSITFTVSIFSLFGGLHAMLFDDQVQLYRQASITDPLTHLHNRRYFYQQAKTMLSLAHRHEQQVGLVLCDIDNFKSFNDTYGHDIGDKVLVAFAKALKQQKRQEDTVARFGGEEFVLLLPNTDLSGTQDFAERLRKAIGNVAIEVDGQVLSVSASFGVTTCTSMAVDECLKHSDQALYQAKQQGRNRVVVHQPQPAKAS